MYLHNNTIKNVVTVHLINLKCQIDEILSLNRSDFTIGILRVTFFWDGIQVVSAVLQVGCPLQEEITITQSKWVTSSWTGVLTKDLQCTAARRSQQGCTTC